MPPKRKAAAAAAEEEAPPRRLTRSTATTTSPAELPPTKRTKRGAKADDGAATKPQASKTPSAPFAAKATARASRATTRARKADADTEDQPAAEPSVPKKRAGRSKKTQPEVDEEVEESHPEEPVAPPKATRANVAKAAPVKRTRSSKVEEEAEESNPEEPVAPPKATRKNAAKAAPTKRIRSSKVEEEAQESNSEEPVAPPKPLSPIRANAATTVSKKRTRSTKAQEAAIPELEPQPNVAESSRSKRARRTKDTSATTVADAEEAQPPQAHASPSTVKGRTKRKAAAAGSSAAAKAVPPKVSSPVKAKSSAARAKVAEDDGDESSDDELLLTSANRPATPSPTRTIGSRMGTPRMVLDSVEIRTPRHLLSTVKRSLGSPTPRGSARAAPLGTPRLPPASGSPSKRNVPRPPSSTLRQRDLRTPTPEPALPPPVSPTRTTQKAGAATPSKRQRSHVSQRTDGLPRDLPEDLHPLLVRQKRAILKSLQQPPEIDEITVYGEDYPPTNTAAYEQLSDLLTGSVVRGEGNSCLLIGPSGSGKTQMVERAIAALPAKPIVVRLSGYAQHNDRLAIREIAWQLAQQTGTSFLSAESDDTDDEDAEPSAPVEQGPETVVQDDDEDEGDDEENPFIEHAPAASSGTVIPMITLPPPSHLLALISMIPTLPRPTIIVLDGFDLFASHARQALLYCLLDTAQACRTVTGSGSGMAVVGVTARVDTINILEKRVKSRFSGRMIRTACPTSLDHWVALAKAALGTPLVGESVVAQDDEEEWAEIWGKAVESFLEDEGVMDALRDVYALTRDFQIFRRIMTCLTLELTAASPYPTLKMLKAAISRQRCPARYPPLHTLPYPALCLLVAQVHAQTSGHDVFTFEMLHDAFKRQVRASQAAPVQLQGGGVGMVRCSREVLFSAFERLVDLRIFAPAAAPAAGIAKEFALHRSAVDRTAVKKAVEHMGQMSLRKWFTKA